MAKHKNKKVETAASGGSIALLNARLKTGAGKHTDRKATRHDERRRWMEDQDA